MKMEWQEDFEQALQEFGLGRCGRIEGLSRLSLTEVKRGWETEAREQSKLVVMVC